MPLKSSRKARSEKSVRQSVAGNPGRRKAIAQALLVTFLWSTSWVLIKDGLKDMPPLLFAGLRYTLAFVCLLPFVFRRGAGSDMRSLRPRQWLQLTALGIVLYAVTQGAQFAALVHLPAVTLSLMLNFAPALLALVSFFALAERPRPLQAAGILVFLVGAWLYFQPDSDTTVSGPGLALGAVCLVATAVSAVLGRSINRGGKISPGTVTLVSMGAGSLVLLVVALLVEGWQPMTSRHWLMIGWLSVVNTAFAFTLWNRTLRVLEATESSMINNTMLIQIAVLAWIFLGEALDGREIFALLVATAGVAMVQFRSEPVTKPIRRQPVGVRRP